MICYERHHRALCSSVLGPLARLTAPVHLSHLRLRDFRNYARLDADFAPGFHLFLGDNAQGKTNVLEAIYLLATLRSLAAPAEPRRFDMERRVTLSEPQSGGRQSTRCRFIGRSTSVGSGWTVVRFDGFPSISGTSRAVIFSSEDLQLVRDGQPAAALPGIRRSPRRIRLTSDCSSATPKRCARAMHSSNGRSRTKAPWKGLPVK